MMDHEKLADKAAHAAKSAGDYLADVRDSMVDTAGEVADEAREMMSDAAEFVQKTYKKAADKEKDIF